MMTPQRYYSYLESLARSHVQISHTDTEKHFFRGELEEFYTNLRNRVKFPALIAESYELGYDEEFKYRESSFIVAQEYGETKDWNLIYSSFNLCENIGDEILEKMRYDADGEGFCANVKAISATPIINESHLYAGMRYTVQFKTPRAGEIDKTKWRL